MKTAQPGIDLIKRFESFRSKPYLCPASVCTIGYGTTIYPSGNKVTLQDPEITESEACVYLRYDVAKFESGVSKLVTSKINQNQFDSLVSFSYNLGLENFRKSTLLKKINTDPSDQLIRNEFGKWIRAGGKILKGLVSRRLAEANLYFNPI